jgi:hypothetical protein
MYPDHDGKQHNQLRSQVHRVPASTPNTTSPHEQALIDGSTANGQRSRDAVVNPAIATRAKLTAFGSQPSTTSKTGNEASSCIRRRSVMLALRLSAAETHILISKH